MNRVGAIPVAAPKRPIRVKGLDKTGLVGGPHRDLIRAGRIWCPSQIPLSPGKRIRTGCQLRGLPIIRVDTYLNFGNPAWRSIRHALNGDLVVRGDRGAIRWTLDDRVGLDAGNIRPAVAFPKADVI